MTPKFKERMVKERNDLPSYKTTCPHYSGRKKQRRSLLPHQKLPNNNIVFMYAAKF